MRSKLSDALCAISLLLFASATSPAIAQSNRCGEQSRADGQAPAVDQPGRREWVWQGRDSLTVAGSGTVRYEPGGTPRIIVTGDTQEVGEIEVDGGVICKRDSFGFRVGKSNLNILVQGVTLNEFNLAGSPTMELGRLQRDTLTIHISGSGTVDAQGQARTLKLVVSGSGKANLDQLSGDDADVTVTGSGVSKIGAVKNENIRVTGSGTVVAGPSESVEATVTGSGSVRLSSTPAHSNYHVTGSGRVFLVGADGKTTEIARMQRPGRDRAREDRRRDGGDSPGDSH